MNMFKESFKYYKSRNPNPCLEHVLDFHCDSFSLSGRVRPIILNAANISKTFDLDDISTWKAYEIIAHPGFVYVSNPFTSIGQRYWIHQALEEFTRKPNKLNIDVHGFLPPEQNWWDLAQQERSILKKLRWSTLGYHYNWDTKIYTEEARDLFPNNLSNLCSTFAKALGYSNFRAEAAIVNFYHLDSTLSGHTDHSEESLDAPLFSFSFGSSAIFLLGGPTIDEHPTAVFLHSGDVVVMSKASRLSYHAVPRIVRSKQQPWNDFSEHCYEITDELYTSAKNFKAFHDYAECSRINLNVRQVLRHGQTELKSG